MITANINTRNNAWNGQFPSLVTHLNIILNHNFDSTLKSLVSLEKYSFTSDTNNILIVFTFSESESQAKPGPRLQL